MCIYCFKFSLFMRSFLLYNDDTRVKRSKSRSCLHDKAFELGTRKT